MTTGAQRFFLAGNTRFATAAPSPHAGLTVVFQMTDTVLLYTTRINPTGVLAVPNQTKCRQTLCEVAAITCPTQASREVRGTPGPRGRGRQLRRVEETHCPTALTKENQKYPDFICSARHFYRVMLQLK